MFKKLVSFALATTLVVALLFTVGAEDRVKNADVLDLRLADEKFLSTATLEDDFNDDSIVIIFTRAASRDNRDLTARNFRDIGAVEVTDIVRISDREYAYAQGLWNAEQSVRLSGSSVAMQNYSDARREAAENTLVNFEEVRRVINVRLDRNCKENVLQVVQRLQKREDLQYVGVNYICTEIVTDSLRPNDEFYVAPPSNANHQWAVNRINLPAAWGITTGVSTVRVGILDTAIDGTHPDLINRIDTALSRDFVDFPGDRVGNSLSARAPTRHGSHVAGIVGAQGNNGIGIAGTAWNIRLVSLRVINNVNNLAADRGHLRVAWAIDYARERGIPILNASLSIGVNDSANQPIRTAVRMYNGLFIQSAGNDNLNTNNNPRFGGFPNVIVVGASDSNDVRGVGSNSNHGSTSVHLFAPGEEIISTVPTDTTFIAYQRMSGTSQAAPHVAGVAALILSRHLGARPEEIKWAILEGADRGTRLATRRSFNGLCITGGRLNAHRALLAMQSIQSATIQHMTYGVHHIRNSATGRYLDSSSNSVFIAITREDVHWQRWVVQRMTPSTFQIRASNSSAAPGSVQMVGRNGSNAVLGTTVNDVTVTRNLNDGTVTFLSGGLALSANAQGALSWATPVSNSANQRWLLEPHRLNYQRGDVDGNGTINVTDMNTISQYVMGTRVPNAVQFFQADLNRDGSITDLDVTQIHRFLDGQTSVLDGWH
jgi:subtilisin family serine protease